jgi:hypothetical protein
VIAEESVAHLEEQNMKSNRSTAVVGTVILLCGCTQHANSASAEPKGVPIGELITQIEGALDEVSSHRPSGLPPLNSITLTLETFAKRATTGEVKLYVVTVDGSVSESALQTITLKLLPPASVGNQPKLRSNLPIKEILSQAIIDAARQTSVALQDRKDLSLSELAASIRFVVEKSGGAEAKLEALPVNLSAKQTQEESTTNVIDVTFKSSGENPT